MDQSYDLNCCFLVVLLFWIYIWRAVGRSPKCIGKTSARRIRRIWETLIGKFAMNCSKLLSFIPFRFPYDTCFMFRMAQVLLYFAQFKIFSNIIHQPALSEVRPNTAPFFSENVLENFLVQESYLRPGLTFNFIRQWKEAQSCYGSLFE